MFTRILVPTDFSEAALAGTRMAGTLAERTNASLVLVHVFDPDHMIPHAQYALSRGAYEQTIGRLRKRANERLEEARADLPEDVEVKVKTVLLEGNAALAITKHAAEMGADLIVMSTHGRGGFQRFLLGSVTEKTVRLAHCPVLTVPVLTAPASPD